MLKCALAGAAMALFVCHSAEHHFTQKKNTFLHKFADRGKKINRSEKKRVEVGILRVTCGQTEPCPLLICDINVWKFQGGWEKVLKKLTFSAISFLTNCFATAHSPVKQQSLSPPAAWIFMISSLFFSALWAGCFFFTQRPVVLCLIGPDIWKGPWIKEKKSCLWQLENSPRSGVKVAFWKEHGSCIFKC